MVKSLRFLGACVLLFSATVQAKSIQLESLGYEESPSHYTPRYSRAIINLSSAVSYKVFALQNPPRVVLDFKDTVLPDNVALPSESIRLIKHVRTAIKENKTLRVVIDLKQNARWKVIVLEPDNVDSEYRLFIDLFTDE